MNLLYFSIGILFVIFALAILYRSIKAFPESFKDGMTLWFIKLLAYLFVGGGAWIALLLFLVGGTFIYAGFG